MKRVLSVALATFAVLAISGSALAAGIRTDTIQSYASMQMTAGASSGFTPHVKATNSTTASMGTDYSTFATDLHAWFNDSFGWSSNTPVHFVLFPDAMSFELAAESFRGAALSGEERNVVMSRPTFLMRAMNPAYDIPAGDWVILVNTDINAAREMAMDLNNLYDVEVGFGPLRTVTNLDAMRQIQYSMVRDYTMLMEMQVAGMSGATWYREGLADAIAFRIVPGTPQESGMALMVARFQEEFNNLPSLGLLTGNWSGFTTLGPMQSNVASGIAFLSATNVFNSAGSMNAVRVLQSTAGGTSFESALQTHGGFTLEGLNQGYQSLIPVP